VQTLRKKMGDVGDFRHVLNIECDAMDPIFDNHQRGHGLLPGVPRLGQLDLHGLHDYLYTAHLPGILDSRQMGKSTHSQF